MRALLQDFQKCDLYSKDDEDVPDYAALETFYRQLADRFVGLHKVLRV
jgi:hypothetical protein